MYSGRCPYCGKVFTGDSKEIVKIDLKYHMIKEHYNELLIEGLRTKYCKLFKEEICVEWMAGTKAASLVKHY